MNGYRLKHPQHWFLCSGLAYIVCTHLNSDLAHTVFIYCHVASKTSPQTLYCPLLYCILLSTPPRNKTNTDILYVSVVEMKEDPFWREYSSRSDKTTASDSLLPCRLCRVESDKPRSTTWYMCGWETVGGFVLKCQQHIGNSCTSVLLLCVCDAVKVALLLSLLLTC